MSDVQTMLADSVSDFERIIAREEELWEILNNKVAQVEKERISAAGDQKTLLEEWGFLSDHVLIPKNTRLYPI